MLAGLALAATAATAGEPKWKKHDINPKAIFESAAAFDVDGDGDRDIVSGDTWYEAPTWAPHHVRDVVQQGTYMNDFATLPMDVDGDGDLDFFTCSYFGKDVTWVENPGKAGGDWKAHQVDVPGPSETAVLVDLTGDGKPEILPNVVNQAVFYELVKAANPPEIKKHDFGKEAAAHGVGSGDVNGDGRVDLLTPKGWFEGPSTPTDGSWVWHPEWTLDGKAPQKNMCPGIQILATDVDGDGLADLIYGMGHDRGLYWRKQAKAADGSRSWGETLVIDPQPSSVHTLLWADLDGDGKANELVTGKRVYAHEREVGATEGSLIAYYRFDRGAGEWKRFVVFQGEPAPNAPEDIAKRNAQKDFPAGTAGTGLQTDAIDIDGDGDLDLVCPGKSGLYVFENLGSGG
jgi:hypothetical protein